MSFGSPVSNKSPAMVLNEICVKSQTLPQYHFQDMGLSGAEDKRFLAKCEVTNFNGRNFECTYMARNKQLAKQEVARLMMKQHMNITMDTETVAAFLDTPQRAVSEIQDHEHIPLDELPDHTRNVIEDLTTYTIRTKLPAPEYVDGLFEGPSHSPVLSKLCRVGNNETEGVHKTKKVCKKIAAWKMLQLLENLEFKNQLSFQVPVPEGDENDGTLNADQQLSILSNHWKTSKWFSADKEYMQVKRRPQVSDKDRLNEARGALEKVRRKFLGITAGPFLTELLIAGDELIPREEFVSDVGKRLIKWLSERKGGGAQDLFDAVQQELEFTVSRSVFNQNPNFGPKMTWRDKRDIQLIGELRKGKKLDMAYKVSDKYEFQPGFKKHSPRPDYVPPKMDHKFMVTISLELKLIKGELAGPFDREPTAVGFGDTEEAAQESSILQLLEYIIVMSRK